MGSQLNFKGFGDGDVNGKLPGNGLARQNSVYSLTFDEFQSTLGGHGKDFGSMNMDELLKNIWTAEETQALATASVCGAGGAFGGNLQRQGSLTLPRTLSQKTVDEVWKDLLRETGGSKDEGICSGGPAVGSGFPQRQPTLGEMTLEEFLVRAGVVREDAQQNGIPEDVGFFGQHSNTGFNLGFQQDNRNNGFMGSNTSVYNQPASFGMNVGMANPTQQRQQLAPQQQQLAHQQQRRRQQQQQLFPKQPALTVTFPHPIQLVNPNQLSSSVAKSSVISAGNPQIKSNLLQPGGPQNGAMAGLVSPGSQISSDVMMKSSGDNSPISPVPCMFGKGRKTSATLEKVVERRQRRMIKNRESAARSRARKQAYTLELEAEVAKLKELNQELQRKQVEMMEMQKNQMDSMIQPWATKRQCLRRTLTSSW